ncbi:MAG: methyltransferase domain-containing protein [Firmicutes bacterium]|nr:methyltransferase domain-containing protein [Bacillota bacterium]
MNDQLKLSVARSFDRASQTYSEHGHLQRQVSNMLLQRMARVYEAQPKASCLLDLGCGPGVNLDVLSNYCAQYIGLDLSAEMLRQSQRLLDAKLMATETLDTCATCRWVQADMDALPIAPASLDIIFSNLAVQWSSQPKPLLQRLVDCLRPGGHAFISTLISGGMQPLADLRASIDGKQQVNSQLDLQQWQQMLPDSATVDVQWVPSRVTVYSPTLRQLLGDIRGVGASVQTHQTRALTPHLYKQLMQRYEDFREPSGLPLHYEVLCIYINKAVSC